MITVDEKEVLRRKVLIEGLSIRQVARENGCARETVKRALVDPSASVYHIGEPRECSVMAPFREVIDEWLLGDRKQPVKQRHTAPSFRWSSRPVKMPSATLVRRRSSSPVKF
jgi:transposase